jgi:hypothetical protein
LTVRDQGETIFARGEAFSINCLYVPKYYSATRRALNRSSNRILIPLRDKRTNGADRARLVLDDIAGQTILNHFRHGTAVERNHRFDQAKGLRPIDWHEAMSVRRSENQTFARRQFLR